MSRVIVSIRLFPLAPSNPFIPRAKMRSIRHLEATATISSPISRPVDEPCRRAVSGGQPATMYPTFSSTAVPPARHSQQSRPLPRGHLGQHYGGGHLRLRRLPSPRARSGSLGVGVRLPEAVIGLAVPGGPIGSWSWRTSAAGVRDQTGPEPRPGPRSGRTPPGPHGQPRSLMDSESRGRPCCPQVARPAGPRLQRRGHGSAMLAP
jgi:hypothetical protein